MLNVLVWQKQNKTKKPLALRFVSNPVLAYPRQLKCSSKSPSYRSPVSFPRTPPPQDPRVMPLCRTLCYFILLTLSSLLKSPFKIVLVHCPSPWLQCKMEESSFLEPLLPPCCVPAVWVACVTERTPPRWWNGYEGIPRSWVNFGMKWEKV